MKEDVVAANLANLRQSINELKVYIEKQNATVPKPEQSVKADFNEKAIYTGIAKSFCTCWNEALSVVKKHIWQQQPNTLPFSLWFPKLIDLFIKPSLRGRHPCPTAAILKIGVEMVFTIYLKLFI